MNEIIKSKINKMFDEKFGYAIFNKKEDLWGDSIGRDVGCDDCDRNKDIRQEHKDFIDQIIDLAIAEERKRLLEGLLVDMSALNMFNADDMAYVHKIIKNRFN